jgi:hypothetical protein
MDSEDKKYTDNEWLPDRGKLQYDIWRPRFVFLKKKRYTDIFAAPDSDKI